ncbi:MAG: mechanosensitive ion channel [Gemmatimonadales bacterium]|jgi:miniconductance mechanosensitive channel
MGETLNSVIAWLGEHQLAAQFIAAFVLLVLAYVADKVTKWVLLRAIRRVVKGTAFTWDDVLLKHRAFARVAHLAPVLAIYYGIQLIPNLPGAFVAAVQHAALAAMVFVGVLVADSLLSAGGEIYAASPMSKGRPIKGYIQALKIVLYLLGAILVIASLTGQSPLIMLSGFAAFSAVLLLVFRDTILSFVASSQIATYDMMRVGDWIEMPEYGADGDVVDIGLHTIKVQNWDKTIVTIPTHKLLSDSFKNWRAMSESGGRRIKRALYVDMQSIRFLKDGDIERFEQFYLLKDYMAQKKKELAEYNASRVGDTSLIANARRLTNIGTFRAYVTRYLRDHPRVHQNMTLMVRQLNPTPEGLPLEIYVFSNDVGWVNYEGIQADIFDHIIAIVPEFDLRVFQVPSGRDFAALARQGSGGGQVA